MRAFLLSVLLLLLSSSAFAQTKQLAWEQSAPTGQATFTSAAAQGYLYKWYRPNQATSTVLTAVTCTTTNQPLVKTCSAPLPGAINAGDSVTLTASFADGSNESGPSNVATFVLPIPPNPPSGLRIAANYLRNIFTSPSLFKGATNVR